MEEKEYLNKVLVKLQKILGENLIGLYQIGSACLGEYKKGKSDLDIIGVVKSSLSKDEKDLISNDLDHKKVPCPAKGLDLVLLSEKAVKEITYKPKYEFWFATGGSWKNEGWESGSAKEMLIFIELAREHGITIFGKSPDTLFNSVNKKFIVDAFLEMLKWHQTKILDPFHDPKGQYSVLNACRVLAFVKDDKLLSKSDGGKWMLKREPDNTLVANTLSIRNSRRAPEPTKEEISDFLVRIIEEVKLAEN